MCIPSSNYFIYAHYGQLAFRICQFLICIYQTKNKKDDTSYKTLTPPTPPFEILLDEKQYVCVLSLLARCVDDVIKKLSHTMVDEELNIDIRRSHLLDDALREGRKKFRTDQKLKVFTQLDHILNHYIQKVYNVFLCVDLHNVCGRLHLLVREHWTMVAQGGSSSGFLYTKGIPGT